MLNKIRLLMFPILQSFACSNVIILELDVLYLIQLRQKKSFGFFMLKLKSLQSQNSCHIQFFDFLRHVLLFDSVNVENICRYFP